VDPLGVVVVDVRLEEAPEVPFAENDHVVSNSRRQVPTHRSADGFCQGLRYAVRTGSIPRFQIVADTVQNAA
jgi:hypothetical protein